MAEKIYHSFEAFFPGMEFEGVGVVPFDVPPEELRPYFVKKYSNWVR